MTLFRLSYCLLFCTLVALGCKRGPKLISSSEEETPVEQSTGIFKPDDSKASLQQTEKSDNSNDIHMVQVLEVLPASKYVYLQVKENKETYWIATLKKEVVPGEMYFYRNGLLKTNFESKEYNRVFDKVYLVSNLVKVDHGDPSLSSNKSSEDDKEPKLQKSVPFDGSITIKDLVSDMNKYAGQTVKVSGTCVKLNPNIMGRNWIHLKDGSMDEFDLVITSDVQVSEGQQVAMSAKVILDKDFGAGYKYDLILEEGKVLQLIQ